MDALRAPVESIDGLDDGATFLRGLVVEGDQQWLIPKSLRAQEAPQEEHATDRVTDGATGYAQAVTNVLRMQRMQHLHGSQIPRPNGQSLPNEDQLPFQLQPLWLRDRISRPPTLSLQPLQEWEGYVTSVGAEAFTARLVDITADKKVEGETADFPISDLSDDNLALLREGAIFRWVIGYQRAPGGTKRRVSDITFRRLPAWTRRDLEQAHFQATQLLGDIAWE